MSDFYQTGLISTFHRFPDFNLKKIEDELVNISERRGITLILPSLFSELEGKALKKIINELKDVQYLRELVVTLGPVNDSEYEFAKKFFSLLPQQVTIIRNNGKRIVSLYDEMREKKITSVADGKGRSVWMAYGYILSSGKNNIIGLHDCDIETYSRELLSRLLYPVASTKMDYEFCKGYYIRVKHKMHGRVTRLFVTPLIRALMKMVGRRDILVYFDSFRYPLSGECSMVADLARICRLPSDWGLEIGTLAEVYRNCALKRISQIELCENYEHKHQPLSPQNKDAGLNKMAIDIAKSLFRTLASQNIVFSQGFLNSLKVAYLRIAEDMVNRYHGDASINDLDYDIHEEESAVEVFTNAISIAGDTINKNPLGPKLIPNWNRVFAAIPDLPERLLEAVMEDNR